jgi:type II secretory pathway component PulJ
MIMPSNRRSEKGFGILLELLVAMAISTILLAGSTVAIYRVQAAQNQIAAQQRLRQVAQAQAVLAICAQTSGCVPSIGLAAIIPPDGSSIAQSGYLFQYSNNSGLWFMTAVPVSQSFSGQATYWTNYTGILRCMPDNDPSAGPSSPTC